MPSSLPAAVTRRLEALPDELGPLLDAAAGAGPVTVERLAEVMETADDSALHRKINHAERAGLLVVDEGLVVRFTHPVIAAAVYDRMGGLARRSLHARLAEERRRAGLSEHEFFILRHGETRALRSEKQGHGEIKQAVAAPPRH